MEAILYQYELTPTTWVYLSSFILIAVFFKFSRVLSVRNLDLIGLICFAPGLIIVAHGRQLADPALAAQVTQIGFLWLFVVGLLFLIRLLGDPMMVRRPLLEPNLTPGGLTFMGVSLLIFMIGNVLARQPTQADIEGCRQLDMIFGWQEPGESTAALGAHGPGYPLIHLLPRIPSRLWETTQPSPSPDQTRQIAWIATAKLMAILGQLAVVSGLVLIGYRHFDKVRTGVAVATIYLLLPYTAQFAGRVDHIIPAALLVWAVLAYRSPLIAGMLLGLATGVIYYPVFLLPLWGAFYWQRGLFRFASGALAMMLLLVGVAWLTSRGDTTLFTDQVRAMFGVSHLSLFRPASGAQVDGFWNMAKAPYRITVWVTFLALSLGMAIWPARKNLGTLISCSAAVMLGTQFWHAHEGGLYMGWYLPLLVLTIFRPNLEDKMAVSSLVESKWILPFPWRRAKKAA